MKVLAIVISIIILTGIVWIAVSNRGVPNDSSFTTQFEKAPNFALSDYNGNTVSLADFAGKPLIINSWAAWCPFCVEEMPDFAQAQEEFREQIAVILINRAESLSIAKKFSDEVGVTGRLILLLDPPDSFYRSIGGFSMPETLFVDKEGNIIIHKRGPMRLPEIREKVNQIL